VKEEPVKPVVEKPVVKERVVEVRPEVKPVVRAKEESYVMDTTVVDSNVVLDETSVITASTILTGNLASAGSFDIQGTVNGNVSCNGKLVVTGMINGNSTSSEFFADVAKIEGEVISTGTVKIGAGSVIIGNITASSAVIAGAVKGDIDVQGPVVVDTSAVIMGNIKSRSVQINNGAIIEGFCSQCYADVDVQGIFGK
jgi:cytoskeletal protein CcmA (bactofilin family)